MALLYGRAGRLTAKNGGFRPLVPPPVWSTIYLLLQKVTSPRFTIPNGFRPLGAQETLKKDVKELSSRASYRTEVVSGQVRKVFGYL